MTSKTKLKFISAITGLLAGMLFTISVSAGAAAADPGDTNGGGSTSTETTTDGDRTIGDIIHDIFCPPESEEPEEEAEEPAAEPPKVEVAVNTPAKPVVNEKDDPICSTDPNSQNYCPPEED